MTNTIDTIDTTDKTDKIDHEQKINSVTTSQPSKQHLQRLSRFQVVLGVIVFSLIVFELYFYYYGTRSLSQDLSLLSKSSRETATTTAVKTAFLVHKQLADNSINVTTSNGVVTLKGNVNWLADKIIAEEVARNTRGVENVVNYITVIPNKTDDQYVKDLNTENKDLKTQNAMFEALLANKELTGQQVRVSVDNQILTLDGLVNTQEQKDLVIKTGLAIPGIQGVKADKLIVIPMSSK